MDKWRFMLLIFSGQLMSLMLAVASFTSSYIAKLGVDAPLTQSFFAYLLLAVFYASVFLYQRKKLLVSWYWYLVLALLDVVGSYLVITAYQYSSITSVTLLDCCTIPWVIILTWFLLGTRYSLWQFFGAALCVAGLVLVLLSDSGVSGGGGKKPFLGDVLVIAGTVFYASSNVGMEFCVKKKDLVEVVMMLGVFGALSSAFGISIFERKDLESVKWSPTMISLFIGYAVATFLSFTIGAFFLQMSGATLFNLSLLTSDMWAVLIRIFFYHQQVDWLYYLSFAVVAIGLVIYSLKSSNVATDTVIDDEDQEASIQYEPLVEENLEATIIEDEDQEVSIQHEPLGEENLEARIEASNA